MIQNAKILNVDLSEKTISVTELSSEIYRKYPGGSALGMYLMLKEMDPAVSPLSPENLLIFAVSPLTGFPISGQSRMCVTTKSPLTGAAGDSQVGGFIPAQLAANGYDAVVIKGKAERPAYLYIDKEKVEIREAKALWGKTTGETEEMLQEELGDAKWEASVIGPAGENLVKYAAIMHRRSRANGRNGVGAVMGAKNLKAMVVKRQTMPKAADMEALKKLTLDVKERMAANPVIVDLSENGSAGTIEAHAGEGFLPSFNWDAGILEDWEKIAGGTITKEILKERDTCYGCAIRCKGVVEVPGKADPEYGGPEYETVCTFGSYCGNTDLGDICQANQLCNMYGLDTISCGATIAFAMDCFEKGILTAKDTGGLELKFGDGKVFESLIKKIAMREPGIGELLAEGSYLAAEKLGKEAMDLAVTCKKQEWPAHMVQMKPNLLLHYAVNNHGADHQSVEHDPALMAPDDDQNWIWPNLLGSFEKVDAYGILDENKAKFTLEMQKFYSTMDTLCLCQFAWGPAWQLYGPKDLVSFCKAAADWDTTLAELQEIGERRLVMMRMFNTLIGMGRKDDDLPKKSFLPITGSTGDTFQLTREEFEKTLDTYYEIAGWDTKTGVPSDATLHRLGLEWIKR